MKQKEKFTTIKDALNLIGDSPQIFKTITQTEAVLFIRDLMSVANSGYGDDNDNFILISQQLRLELESRAG